MPLYPDDLEEITCDSKKKIYKVSVNHCSMCPFSMELVAEDGDYLGNECQISECKYYLTDSTKIPKKCPLKKKHFHINIGLGKEK